MSSDTSMANHGIRYFGILKPGEGYIWWIDSSELGAWQRFFKDHAYALPLAEAIEAYEAIGYKCVELEIRVKNKES